jgi:acyl-CoA dehydrogenase
MSDEVTPEDFQAILAQLRDWVRTKVVPREREIADADAIPDDLRKQAADMGLFGYAIPPEWGGLGLDLTQDVELAMELGYTSLAVRSMFGTNNGIAGQVLVNFGTDEQKAAWLGRLAAGEVVASFALTEPGAGSNPAGLQTGAARDGADWVIDGQKRFITNAPSADLFVVFARTRPADASGTGIAVFLVPADAAGVEVGAKDRKMGQEGAWTSDVHFSDVRVPASALVGGDVDAGYRAAMTSLARGRVHIAALAVGTAQRALDESVAYAASATQGGTVIGEFQLVQAMLADQQTGVLAGRALVRETAARYVSGEDRRIGPSAAKLFCTEMAGQVADLAVQIHGGSGYMRDMPVERIYRDVRLLRLYEGTSEIQRLIIGGGLVRAQQRRLNVTRGVRPAQGRGRSPSVTTVSSRSVRAWSAAPGGRSLMARSRPLSKVHVVALADLGGAAVPAPVVSDHPVAVVQEEKHLGVPVVRRQGPPVAEDDRLPGPPVLEVDLSSVSGRERTYQPIGRVARSTPTRPAPRSLPRRANCSPSMASSRPRSSRSPG